MSRAAELTSNWILFVSVLVKSWFD